MPKPFPDILFTRHSDPAVLERKKKTRITPCKIMTDTQNMNKTTMKDVQLEHFLFKTASRIWNVSENLVFLCVCWLVFFLFFFNRWTSLEARLSVITLTFYLQLLQLGILDLPLSICNQKINLSLCIFLKALREAIDIVFLSQTFMRQSIPAAPRRPPPGLTPGLTPGH